ncbi:MAG: hypothetical protein ACYCZH_09710 [Sulfuriferula sp.]
MKKHCPSCDLPMIRLAACLAVNSNDGTVHGVLGLCERCVAQNRSLPAIARFKRISRAGDRALERPDKYQCALFPDSGSARLAAAMLGHPQHVHKALNALGWGSDASQPE